MNQAIQGVAGLPPENALKPCPRLVLWVTRTGPSLGIAGPLPDLQPFPGLRAGSPPSARETKALRGHFSS